MQQVAAHCFKKGKTCRMHRAVCSVLAKHPDVRLLIEGHVGTSAPDEIAQSYSEHRAHVVAMMLEQHFQIDGDRLMTRGWGKDIAEAAAQSSVRQPASLRGLP